MNAIGRLHMQLRYPWLISFVSKNQQSIIHDFTKLKGSPVKRLDKDEVNGIERLYMQLNYSWLNSFVRKNVRQVQWTRIILTEILMACLLRFLTTLNW